MRLPREDLLRLKQPFGVLIRQQAISRDLILAFVKGATKVISVGDATTARLAKDGVIPDLSIVDGKERRKARKTPSFSAAQTLQVSNPAGGISHQAVGAVRSALGQDSIRIRMIVTGEEDLLVLPACVYAPLGSAILYGQPLEGLVVVEVTTRKKQEAQELMDKLTAGPSLPNRK